MLASLRSPLGVTSCRWGPASRSPRHAPRPRTPASSRGSRSGRRRATRRWGAACTLSGVWFRVTVAPGASGSTISNASLPLDLAASSCPTFCMVAGASFSSAGRPAGVANRVSFMPARQRREQAVDALEARRGPLDRARSGRTRGCGSGPRARRSPALHLDQVAEVEHLALVAVAHQHVEVGVDDGCLVAAGDLERGRLDAVRLGRPRSPRPGWSSDRRPPP